MTNHRTAGSVEAVLTDVLRALSDDDIESATGKTRWALAKAANPMERRALSFAEAAALDNAMAAIGKPRRFSALWEDLASPGAHGDVSDLYSRMHRVVIESGELFTVADQAMADGSLSLDERRRIAREAQDVSDAALSVRDIVEPPRVVDAAE